MEFEELVRTRRSVRGFKDDPVPRQLIDEIIAVAKGAFVDEQPTLACPCPGRCAAG